MSEASLRPVWRIGGVVAVIVTVVALLLWLVSRIPNLNPFAGETVDRSAPAVLQSVRDLSQYHAAVGDFQVVVDLEKDVPWVPDAIAGERTLFVAAGTVSAYVDFGGLDENALAVDQEAHTVKVRLPEPVLARASLDQKRSYVFSQERGAVNLIEGLFTTPDQQELYVLAEEKISQAAKSAKLTERAARNTRDMLRGLFDSLGYRAVFGADPGSRGE